MKKGKFLVACYTVFNEEHLIADSIRSVKAYVDSFLVVDSAFDCNPVNATCSTDNTRKIIEKLCDPKPLEYIASDRKLSEIDARNMVFNHVAIGDWALVIDADERLYGDYSRVNNLLAEAKAGKIGSSVDFPLYTTAVNFNGMATDMNLEDFNNCPIIDTVGYAPRLFEIKKGMHYRTAASEGHYCCGIWYADGSVLNGATTVGVNHHRTDSLFIINHHAQKTFKDYQETCVWEMAAAESHRECWNHCPHF